MSATPMDPLASLLSLNKPKDPLGVMLLGTYTSLLLYGMTMQRSYRYFKLYPGDDRWIKGLVGTIVLAETAHILLCCYVCYVYVAFDRFLLVSELVNSWYTAVFMIASTATILMSLVVFEWRILHSTAPRWFYRRYLPLTTTESIMVFTVMVVLIGKFLFMWTVTTVTMNFALLIGVIIALSVRQSDRDVSRIGSTIRSACPWLSAIAIWQSSHDTRGFMDTMLDANNLKYVAFIAVVAQLNANIVLVTLSNRKPADTIEDADGLAFDAKDVFPKVTADIGMPLEYSDKKEPISL